MTDAEMHLLLKLLNSYGHAKFGDEWWPSNAAPWIGERNAAELSRLLEMPKGTPTQLRDNMVLSIELSRDSFNWLMSRRERPDEPLDAVVLRMATQR